MRQVKIRPAKPITYPARLGMPIKGGGEDILIPVVRHTALLWSLKNLAFAQWVPTISITNNHEETIWHSRYTANTVIKLMCPDNTTDGITKASTKCAPLPNRKSPTPAPGDPYVLSLVFSQRDPTSPPARYTKGRSSPRPVANKNAVLA